MKVRINDGVATVKRKSSTRCQFNESAHAKKDKRAAIANPSQQGVPGRKKKIALWFGCMYVCGKKGDLH